MERFKKQIGQPTMIEKMSLVPVNSHYYQRYCNFITKIRNLGERQIEGELHHILPKSIFPQFKKERDNIVLLSYREHLIAHMILKKCFVLPKHKKSMWMAFMYMVDTRKEFLSESLNKQYEKYRTLYKNEWLGQVKFSKEHREKISNYARKRTGEKNPFYGKNHTDEFKKKLSEHRSGVSWGCHTEDHKRHMSEKLTGIVRSEETKKKISESHNVKYICPHCNKTGGRMMLRWHFDKCREINNVRP